MNTISREYVFLKIPPLLAFLLIPKSKLNCQTKKALWVCGNDNYCNSILMGARFQQEKAIKAFNKVESQNQSHSLIETLSSNLFVVDCQTEESCNCKSVKFF